MRILIDENMPPQFRHHFPSDDVRSAQFMGWRSRHNGALVRLGRDLFDVLITKDKTIDASTYGKSSNTSLPSQFSVRNRFHKNR